MRSDVYIQARNITVRETVDARKVRHGAGDLRQLFARSDELVIIKGKRATAVDLRNGRANPDDLAAALGPSGNLRAPAIRIGKNWLVGFEPAAWSRALG